MDLPTESQKRHLPALLRPKEIPACSDCKTVGISFFILTALTVGAFFLNGTMPIFFLMITGASLFAYHRWRGHHFWCHHHTVQTNGRDVADRIYEHLVTAQFDHAGARSLHWRDITKIEVSPTECVLTAKLALPRLTMFDATAAIGIVEATIAINPGDRSISVETALASGPYRDNFWELHAGRQLLDELDAICNSETTNESGFSCREIDGVLVMELRRGVRLQTSPGLGEGVRPFTINRMIATAKLDRRASIASLDLEEISRFAQNMVLKSLKWRPAYAHNSHSSFVDFSLILQKELKKSRSVCFNSLWFSCTFDDDMPRISGA